MSANDASAITVTCPACEAHYRVPTERLHGSLVKLRCKSCGHLFDVAASRDSALFRRGRRWYVVIGRQRIGPITAQQVSERLSRGDLSADSFAWCSGMSQWRRLAEIDDFRQVLADAAERAAESDPIIDVVSNPNIAVEPDPQETAPLLPDLSLDELERPNKVSEDTAVVAYVPTEDGDQLSARYLYDSNDDLFGLGSDPGDEDSVELVQQDRLNVAVEDAADEMGREQETDELLRTSPIGVVFSAPEQDDPDSTQPALQPSPSQLEAIAESDDGPSFTSQRHESSVLFALPEVAQAMVPSSRQSDQRREQPGAAPLEQPVTEQLVQLPPITVVAATDRETGEHSPIAGVVPLVEPSPSPRRLGMMIVATLVGVIIGASGLIAAVYFLRPDVYRLLRYPAVQTASRDAFVAPAPGPGTRARLDGGVAPDVLTGDDRAATVGARFER